MISISKINGERVINTGRRILKILTFGKISVNDVNEASPFGLSSSAPNGTTAVYSESTSNGEKILLGYLNTNQTGVERGGFKIYSTDDTGQVQTYIYLRPNGDIELGGNNDNLIRFSALDSGLSNLDTQIQAELTKIAAGISSAGGSYTPGTIETDISQAKIDELKIP